MFPFLERLPTNVYALFVTLGCLAGIVYVDVYRDVYGHEVGTIVTATTTGLGLIILALKLKMGVDRELSGVTRIGRPDLTGAYLRTALVPVFAIYGWVCVLVFAAAGYIPNGWELYPDTVTVVFTDGLIVLLLVKTLLVTAVRR